MQAGVRGPVKIGHVQGDVDAVEARMKTLQTGCPQELRIVAVLPGGIESERLLQQYLGNYHVGGEWFYVGSLVDDDVTREDFHTWFHEAIDAWIEAAYVS